MVASDYVGSELWRQDQEHAAKNFELKKNFWTVAMTAIVEAQAKTGSRYLVVGSFIAIEDSQVLISVVQPWQTCWTMYLREVTDDYVYEHLGDPKREVQHGGDIKAVTLAVNQCMSLLAEAVTR